MEKLNLNLVAAAIFLAVLVIIAAVSGRDLKVHRDGFDFVHPPATTD